MSSDQNRRPVDAAEERVWDTVVSLDPGSTALTAWAKKLIDAGRAGEAIEVARGVLAAHPDHVPAALIEAEALVDLDRLAEARRRLRRPPLDADVMGRWLERIASLAQTCGDEKRSDQASRAARAPQPAPPPAEAQNESGQAPIVATSTLARLYVSQGHMDKAAEIYRALVEQNPDDRDAYNQLIRIDPGAADGPRASKKKMAGRLSKLRKAAERRRQNIGGDRSSTAEE
jgi:predicted Zn-dependent protease